MRSSGVKIRCEHTACEWSAVRSSERAADLAYTVHLTVSHAGAPIIIEQG